MGETGEQHPSFIAIGKSKWEGWKSAVGRFETRPGKWIVFLGIFAVLFLMFWSVSLPGGDDWGIFAGAARLVAKFQSPYRTTITFGHYLYPPWLAMLMVPVGVLPLRVGLALISAGSVCVCFGLATRWKLGLWKLGLILLSPPLIYTILHGQVDALILAGCLLPADWWLLTAVTKPQMVIGLIFGVPKEKLLRAMLITAAFGGVSLLIFGNWPMAVLEISQEYSNAGHNIWRGIWPYQVPIGIGLLLLGLRRKEISLLIGASPFLAPYAATSSLLGPWLTACIYLKEWELTLVWLAWWGVSFFRGIT